MLFLIQLCLSARYIQVREQAGTNLTEKYYLSVTIRKTSPDLSCLFQSYNEDVPGVRSGMNFAVLMLFS